MKPVTGAVIGSVLVPLGLVLGLTWLPSSAADALSYGAAAACKQPVANGAGCWTEVRAVVTGTSVVHRSKHDDWIVSLDDDFGRHQTTVNHNGRVFDGLTASESVTARFWRGNVVLIHVRGSGDLTTDNDPGTQVGWALVATVFTLLGGALFLMGAIGVHRRDGSWTRSVPRDEFGRDMFDTLAPPARRWVQAVFVLLFIGVAGGVLAYAIFGAPLLQSVLVCVGLGALLWAWNMHHRARMAFSGGSAPKSTRKSR